MYAVKKYTDDSSDEDDFISKPKDGVDFAPPSDDDSDAADDSFIVPKKSKPSTKKVTVDSDEDDSEPPSSAPIVVASSPAKESEEGRDSAWLPSDRNDFRNATLYWFMSTLEKPSSTFSETEQPLTFVFQSKPCFSK